MSGYQINSIHVNGNGYGEGFGMTHEAKAEQLDRQPVIDSRAAPGHPVKVDEDEGFVWRCKCGAEYEAENCRIVGDEIHQWCEWCNSYDSQFKEEKNDG